jgi:hypothetical protein
MNAAASDEVCACGFVVAVVVVDVVVVETAIGSGGNDAESPSIA